MKYLAGFMAGAITLIVIWVMDIVMPDKRRHDSPAAATHYVACPGFTQPLAVWGYPIPSGVYLSVKLSADGEWRLIGPNCGIIPNHDNM